MADGWSYADEVYGLIPVQEGAAGARRQPGPTTVPIPGSGQPRQVRPKAQPPLPPNATPPPQPQAAPAEPAKPYSYADEVFSSPVQPKPAAPVASDPNAEPDAPTWWGRRVQDVRGKTDKRYQNLPTLADTGAVMMGDDSVAKLTMPNDEAYADVLTKSLAPGVKMTRRFRDANGYEIVGFTYEDGPEQLAYVNQPGLDTSDVSRGIIGALPFMAGGGLAGRALAKVGAPLLGKVVGQAATGAAVSVGQDAAAYGMGSEQGLDGAKLIGSAAGGALGEVIAPAAGALWRKFVAEPRLFNKAMGRLTPQGEAAAKAAGMDPAEMTAEIQKAFAQNLARAKDARAASIAAETGDMNIPTTLGQRTKDVAQLTREQEMRDGVWGQAVADQMKAFDAKQWRSMVNATMGEIEPGKPGVSLSVNPNRSPGEYTPGQVGAAIAERASQGRKALQQAEQEAWRNVGRIEPTDKALAELPAYIGRALGDLAPTETDASLMPGTISILQQAKAFMEKSPPKAAVDGFLPNQVISDVNRFRMAIGKKVGALDKGTDKQAAGRVYNAVNDWIREMAERNLLTAQSPDAATAAANMVTARGITRNLHEILDVPNNPAGGRIIKQILDRADSPEQVVRELFVGPTAKSIKPGSIDALKSLKALASQLPKEEGEQLMSDIKLAYWLQIVRNPAGQEGENIFNPQVLLRNLRVSSDSQRSVWLNLFTPQEIAMRNRLIRALENGPTFHDWTIKPNSSRSGTTIGRMFMDMMSAVVGQNWAKTGVELARRFTGLNRAAYYNATRQTLPAVNPMLGAPASAGGAAAAWSQE